MADSKTLEKDEQHQAKEEKHIVLAFVSPVRCNKDKDTGLYRVSESEFNDWNENRNQTLISRCSNELPILYIRDQISPKKIDRIFTMLTPKVKDEPVEALQKERVTHFQFLQKCLCIPKPENIDGIENIDDIMNENFAVDYASFKDGFEESFKAVLNLTHMVQNYVKDYKKAKVVVHVDITGGARDANIILLIATRLLQFQGVEIGHVVYGALEQQKPGYIVDITGTYKLFDVIAGAEEFARYGSVQTMKDYFEPQNKSKELDNLLTSMGELADAINVSKRGQFDRAFKNLQASIDNFKQSSNSQGDMSELNSASNELLNDKLFQLLLNPIENSYHDVLNSVSTSNDSPKVEISSQGKNNQETNNQETNNQKTNNKKTNNQENLSALKSIDVIQWCLDHDYLQQALTLFTESVPDYIYAIGITVDAEKAKPYNDKSKNDPLKRERLYLALNEWGPDYLKKSQNESDKADNNLTEAQEELRKHIRDKNSEQKKYYKKDFREFFKSSVEKIMQTPNIEPYQLDQVLPKEIELEFKELQDKYKESLIFSNDTKYTEKFWQYLINVRLYIEYLKTPVDKIPYETIKKAKEQEKISPKEKTLPLPLNYAQLIEEKSIVEVISQWHKKHKQLGKYLKNELLSSISEKDIQQILGLKERSFACNRLDFCIQDGLLLLHGIPKDKFLDAMQTYFEIKSYRNDANHAKTDTGNRDLSAQELKEFISTGLNQLRALKPIS